MGSHSAIEPGLWLQPHRRIQQPDIRGSHLYDFCAQDFLFADDTQVPAALTTGLGGNGEHPLQERRPGHRQLAAGPFRHGRALMPLQMKRG